VTLITTPATGNGGGFFVAGSFTVKFTVIEGLDVKTGEKAETGMNSICL